MSDASAPPYGPVSWSLQRGLVLVLVVGMGLWRSDAAAIALLLAGAALLALAPRWQPTPCTVLGFTLAVAATPTAVLILPVLVAETFWRNGFRRSVPTVTALFALCLGSILLHRVQPYGWSVVSVVVGYAFSLAAGAWTATIVSLGEQRAQALGELRRSRVELAETSRRAAEVATRARIAQEVHDGVTQRLVLTHLLLDSALAPEHAADPAHVRRRAELAFEQVSAGLDEARRLLASATDAHVAPASPAGVLRDALRSTADSIAAGAGMTVDLDVDETLADALPADVRAAVLHVVREGLTNSALHSGATHVVVRLNRTPDVELIVEDNGSGLSSSATQATAGRGFGLAGARRRTSDAGGFLRTERSPLGGLRLRATFAFDVNTAPALDEPPQKGPA